MANYRLRQTGQEVQDLLDKIEQSKIEDGTVTIGDESLTPVSSEELQQGLAGKQDVISDLSAIREGATLGATAYQKPSDGIAKEDLVASVQASLEKADSALQSYTETDPTVPAWAKESAKPDYSLAELQDDATHRTITDAEKATWNGKQNAIADLDDIRSGAKAGATAVQPSQMQTALAGKQDTLVSGTNIKTVNGENILGSGNIVAGDPNAVKYTEQTLTDSQKSIARTNIGAGTYSKPSGGIPASDIASGVIPDVSQFITKSVNDLVNYYTKSQTYTQTEVNSLIGAIQQFHYEIYASLPASGESNVLYLIGPTGSGTDKYEEYVYASGSFVKIGDTSIDLSQYVTTTALNTALANYTTTANLTTLLAGKQDTINDLADIRSGAAAGATAYQKPSTGIPASDLASGVIPSVPVQDVEVDGVSVLNDGVAEIPAIPTTYAGSATAGGAADKALGIPYGSVDSGSTATDIKATVDNFPTTLVAGVCAYIRNDVVSSASGFTLNINGTGALPVYASNADASRVTTVFSASSTYLFVYNPTRVSGGCWDIYYGYNANDNTVGYMLRTNGAVPPTASKFYRYRLLFTSDDNQNLIPANTSSSTDATSARAVNQAKINPFAPIYYYSTTTAIEAGASPGASYMWLQYSGITLGYSFNRTGAALTMTAKDPVFLKCAPQSDGSAIIDADNPIVQALPTTADGKIYIFLGFAESATAITLYYWHPVYYYKDGAIRIWTNAEAGSSITIDADPTSGSTNAVSSGGVYTALSGKEDTTNKVTSLSSSSTDTQYPSAKCVYDLVGDVETLLAAI